MKRKICVALLALSSGLMMAYAAEPDKCTEKSEASKKTCRFEQAQCKARGATPESCENHYKQCIMDADKALKDCQTKAGVKPAGSPPAKAPAKPAPPKK